MRDLWSRVATTSAARIYWVAGSLATSMVTARFLGPDGRGVYVAAVAWVMLFSTFGHLSLSQVSLHLIAGRPVEEWLSPLVGTLLSLAGAVTIIGWIVAASMYVLTAGGVFHNLDPTLLALAFLALPAFLWIEIGNGVLMALGKLEQMNVALVAGTTASLVLTLAAVGVMKLGLPGALLALVLGQAVTVAISLRSAMAGVVLQLSKTMLRDLVAGSARLHLNAIGTFLFTSANVLIVNHYRPASETAYYQLALQLLVALQIVPTAASAVAYSLVSRKGPDGAWPEQRTLLLQVSAVVMILAAIGYLVAPVAVRLAFGAAFAPTVPLFRIVLIGSIGMTLSIVMGSQWIGRGLFLQAAVLTLLIGAASVVANYLAVPSYGATGAAWVTAGTYGLSIIGNGAMAFWVERRVRVNRARAATAAISSG